MTVQELINILSRVKNKDKLVGYSINGEFKTLDNLIGVSEYADCIEFQYDLTDEFRSAIKERSK